MQSEDTAVAPNDGLAEAMASIPAEPAQAGDGGDKPEAEGGQPRDERGRFAGKAEGDSDVLRETVEIRARHGLDDDDQAGRVPAWRLRELREERDRDRARAEAAERERDHLRAWRAQQERQRRQAEEEQGRPDIYDPDAYEAWQQRQLDRREQAMEQRFQARLIDLTFEAQVERHGKQSVDGAVADFVSVAGPGGSRDRLLYDRVVNSANPGAALMRWHQNQRAMREVGGDLDGYHKKLWDQWKKDPERRKEFMADLDAEARGGNGRSPDDNVTSLPSLNRASGSAGRQHLGGLGSNDAEIYENLTRRRG